VLFELGDTEVEDLNGVTAALIWFEPDVIGFEVAVNYSLKMRLVDCGANLFEDIERPRDRKVLFFFEDLAERAAVEIFHHEVCSASIRCLCESKVGDVHDIRVAETPGSSSFASESLDEFGAFHELRCDDLYGHGPFGPEMCTEIHRSHSATPELTFDLVFAVERLPDKVRKVHTESPRSTEE
jgi:hypothetical protein